MQKIPTLFVRDWNGDRSRVIDEVTPGCEWVTAGEGVATQKLDGTCCLVKDGRLYKRQEIKGDPYEGPDAVTTPEGFVPVAWDVAPGEGDTEVGKLIGWVPVGEGPEDKWHREGWQDLLTGDDGPPEEGTYELIGPKIQGNPERVSRHVLIRHADIRTWDDAPRDFDGLAAWFATSPGIGGIEGLVWHHPDGRMAKVKARDFGIRRVTAIPSGGAADG